MPSKPPEAYLPEDYAMTMLQSFTASCGVAALIFVLQEKPEEEAIKTKEAIIKTWKKTWLDKFQNDMQNYNEVLADSTTTKTEDFPQPEEYQLGFNRALAVAEKSARVSLGLEDEE